MKCFLGAYFFFLNCSEEGRVLSEPFMKLPSRKALPDYYEVIKKPLDINKILTRVAESKVSVFDIFN